MDDATAADAVLLADRMNAAGLTGPVLVVATTTAVAALAPAWAESFTRLGWTHRVFGCGDACSHREVEAIVAEARSVGASALVAAGDAEAVAAGRAAATACHLPVVVCPMP